MSVKSEVKMKNIFPSIEIKAGKSYQVEIVLLENAISFCDNLIPYESYATKMLLHSCKTSIESF